MHSAAYTCLCLACHPEGYLRGGSVVGWQPYPMMPSETSTCPSKRVPLTTRETFTYDQSTVWEGCPDFDKLSLVPGDDGQQHISLKALPDNRIKRTQTRHPGNANQTNPARQYCRYSTYISLKNGLPFIHSAKGNISDKMLDLGTSSRFGLPWSTTQSRWPQGADTHSVKDLLSIAVYNTAFSGGNLQFPHKPSYSIRAALVREWRLNGT